MTEQQAISVESEAQQWTSKSAAQTSLHLQDNSTAEFSSFFPPSSSKASRNASSTNSAASSKHSELVRIKNFSLSSNLSSRSARSAAVAPCSNSNLEDIRRNSTEFYYVSLNSLYEDSSPLSPDHSQLADVAGPMATNTPRNYHTSNTIHTQEIGGECVCSDACYAAMHEHALPLEEWRSIPKPWHASESSPCGSLAGTISLITEPSKAAATAAAPIIKHTASDRKGSMGLTTPALLKLQCALEDESFLEGSVMPVHKFLPAIKVRILSTRPRRMHRL